MKVILIPAPVPFPPPPPPPPPAPTVDIRGITLEDAAVLVAIFGSISGNPDGPRGVTAQLFTMLQDAGIPWDNRRGNDTKYRVVGMLNIDDAVPGNKK